MISAPMADFTNLSHVVILTGAGISAESGLKTFRDNDGLWENHSIDEVATPEAFARNPELVYRFYNQRRAQLHSNEVQPNAAHIALAAFEHQFSGQCLIVTQNVDDLHERAGSVNVLHMHGQLSSARCCRSSNRVSTTTDFDGANRCTCCEPAQPLRPDIVWFGEIPMYMDRIQAELARTELFVSIGTSGNVYPAAGFVEQARQHGACTVELNLEPSVGHNHFSQGYYGPATKIVPQFFSLKGLSYEPI